jgi:flagellar biosynthetic protein FliQ
MNMDQAVDVVREALFMALSLSAPILAIGLCIGLLVSIIQAVTQIQEQTLSFVPKIVGMVMVAIVIAPWVGARLMEFAQRMFAP